ncbi:B-cell receptor CD22-like isoform X5 [Gadus morhua]|uniref:B-cell receptor CD22-like isoform X5 n=1 Tax=Gadus morhua TaxID=8049 RepID=UPI0011B81DF7|nr:B-cell receptor CD22-like isoform X5 [Gadus morhua]
MNLRSAARGFLFFLLSVPVLQSNGDWTVTYSSSNVCALRGATVDINCTYEYPDNVQYRPTTVKPLWFTKASNYQPVVLEHDTEYTGRVEFSRGEVNCTGARCHGTCTLRIRDLRQSDSAVYKFRFTTNQPGGEYTGDPGVKLSVTDPDLQVKVSFPHPTSPTKAKLECHSMCDLAGDPHYIWFRNGQNVLQGMNYWIYIQSGYSYSCAVEGYEHQHSPLVYAPKTPSVTASPSGEIEEGSSVTLSCSSDANPAANYTWFRVNRDGSSRYMNQGPQLIFRRILSSDSGRYRCDTQNKLGDKCFFISINVKYGPKHISVYSSPSGEIEEGSSVTLSCSSDANPAAEYTWFKNNQPLLWEPPHTFPSFRPEDRGTYRCQAENKYGQLRSNLLFMDVKYAPKTPSVTVRPPGEIEEGSSVTLSCSSDANPAANYTWFKNNQPLLWGPSQPHTFPSVRPEDRGTYRCHAENKYGQLSSNLLFINVQYAPKTPSVTVSPSGEIEEGSSVTLSCSSDANPVANYTWFKEHEEMKESGQNYTITNITSEHGGNYYCQAHNAIGLHNATFLLIQVTSSSSSSSHRAMVAVTTIAVLLATVLLLVFLWMRRKRASSKACGQGGRPDTVEEPLPGPLYENVSTLTNHLAPAAQREPIEEQEEYHYASIHTSRSENQEVPRCWVGSNVQSDQADAVFYSVVNIKRLNAVPGVTRQRRQKPQSCTALSKNTPDIERVVAAGFK